MVFTPVHQSSPPVQSISPVHQSSPSVQSTSPVHQSSQVIVDYRQGLTLDVSRYNKWKPLSWTNTNTSLNQQKSIQGMLPQEEKEHFSLV